MTMSRAFVRLLFMLLSLIFMIAFTVSSEQSPTLWTYLWGGCLGIIVGLALMAIDFFFKRFTLRSFNIAVVGLFFGYLMAWALLLIFNAILDITGSEPSHRVIEIVKIFIFLFGTYLGVIMTLKASDEIYISLPFVRFTPTTKESKDLLLDLSALSDFRIIDLAASGIIDRRLVLPRLLLRELQEQEESSDEAIALKAKRSFEIIRKLELLPHLHLRYQDTDFPEIKETTTKLLRLARLLDCDLLSAEMGHFQAAQTGDVRIINLHELSHALKPLMQKGEFLKIKIQRTGKEELQGVGYLEDGTMVVVNGAGEYVGAIITARVLSVKHTTSGRMIFCNITETGDEFDS